jgi:hypothetical protein
MFSRSSTNQSTAELRRIVDQHKYTRPAPCTAATAITWATWLQASFTWTNEIDLKDADFSLISWITAPMAIYHFIRQGGTDLGDHRRNWSWRPQWKQSDARMILSTLNCNASSQHVSLPRPKPLLDHKHYWRSIGSLTENCSTTPARIGRSPTFSAASINEILWLLDKLVVYKTVSNRPLNIHTIFLKLQYTVNKSCWW